MTIIKWRYATLLLLLLAPSLNFAADVLTAEQRDFFENRIRPVLAEQCYKCHNSALLAEGSLALDHRAALLKGGDSGVLITPGKPAESRLLAVLRHEIAGQKMPKGSAKLADAVIADFEKWIALGAPDPRDTPPTAAELSQATSWESLLAKRKQWWSFQPIKKTSPPEVRDNQWSNHPLDQFVLAKLREQGLEPSERAEACTLVRRLYFALIGLPPNAAEVETWTARLAQPQGYEALVDHLLASSHFGERWARHWMDWLRYAESHGSEGDPAIDNIWHYRDYLIRALNANVSYDQLVREHIAGDLLEQPRINQELGINESLIGPAHWRMVFHGFSPTDALEEKVRFIDDEINTFSKAFLGLTVACARCHDHKFDPISQRDYYALFGVLGSCRPGRVAIDTPEKLNANREQLAALKPRIRAAIAQDWLAALPQLPEQLLANDNLWKKAENSQFVLHPWHQLRQEVAAGTSFAAAWQSRLNAWQGERREREEHASRNFARRWNLTQATEFAAWFRYGNGMPGNPFSAGEFSLATAGENALNGIYPSGVYSHSLSAKHAARLSSDIFHLDDNYELYLRVIGEGGASVRYVVQDYPRNGVVFPEAKLKRDWQWQRFDLTYWNGDDLHLELTTAKDAPLLVGNEPRSWFGIREAVLVKKGEPAPPEPREFLDPLLENAKLCTSFRELAAAYAKAITLAVQAWQSGSVTDAQASLLDRCMQQGLLPNLLAELPAAKSLLAEYRRLEEEITVPTRVPGLEETIARNQRLYERGNHKQPGEEVPRRFLEAMDSTPYPANQSGRRQLAEDVLRASNPLTRRVIVNRLWHHLFGRGIVPSPDNFGRLGLPPTHPELLDYLATRFQEKQGSLKDTIRFIVTSQTWQLSSHPSAKSHEIDPDNQFLSHANLRRLEAEAIRDSLLSVSGKLSSDMFGAPVGGNSERRSLYVAVRRNALDPFLRAFDFPEPFSATGRRDTTNVPAQSLTMLNDERVAALASAWAARVHADPQLSNNEARIQSMFLAALGRPAQTAELSRFQAYIAASQASNAEQAKQVTELRKQSEERQAVVRKLIEPIQSRLLAEAKSKSKAGEQPVPQPIARWEFESDLSDTVGAMHGEAREGAKIEAGALVVNQQGYVVTAPIKQAIQAKTLEAWVQLDNLEQRGGGVMSLQTRDGGLFDAIVFAEQSPRLWMAGSNFFQRTQSFEGPQEQEVTTRAVQIAMVYQADGLIIAYRDGQPYGKPYKSNGPLEFKAGEAVLGFGIRHLPGGGNKLLAGRILRAQLFDRALSAEEVLATSQSAPYFVSEKQILAALSEADRQQVTLAKQHIAELDAQIAAFGPVPTAVDDKTLWTDLARAIFTFKEFMYVK